MTKKKEKWILRFCCSLYREQGNVYGIYENGLKPDVDVLLALL